MNETFDLRGDGRVALITGAASGIGRAAAQTFGEAGYSVQLVDADTEAGRDAAAELAEAGLAVDFSHADVASSEEVAAAVAATVQRWGRLDFVLNNAGISGRGCTIEDLDEADLDRVLAVDLKGQFYLCKHVVKVLRTGGGGSIVNVASVTAQLGSAYYAAYSAAKAGVIALTQSLARNVGRFNVRINCINPGSIQGTRLMAGDNAGRSTQEQQKETFALMRKIPLGRIGRPRDVAHLALFLASPLAGHIHGAVLTVDGGESLGYH